MFADSLLNNNWDNRSHRGWTTLASFALQALVPRLHRRLPLDLVPCPNPMRAT